MFVTFLCASRWLVLKMRHRAAGALEDAVSRLPAVAQRIAPDGCVEVVAIERLAAGDLVRVARGEAFPADGRLAEGETEADEALLTGEATPVPKRASDAVVAGSLNLAAPVVLRIERTGADTRYAGVVALLQQSLEERPAAVRAADRIAVPFLLGVLVLAALAAAAWSFVDPARAIGVAVAVLVVTCPCALALAAPSATLAAASALARRGVLVRRLDAIEALASIDTVCFDKTGTLTEGRPVLQAIAVTPAARAMGWDASRALACAASLAATSSHPLASSLAQAGAVAAPFASWTDVHEVVAAGVEGCCHEGRFRLGSASWVGAHEPPAAGPETWLAGPEGVIARLRFGESLRPDARSALATLRARGLRLVLLSGDAAPRVQAMARTLGLETAVAAATPESKLDVVAGLQAQGHRVAMVGDGLNDAPVIGRADVSFALASGSDLAAAHAGFVLLSGRIDDVAAAHAVARRTRGVIRANLAWAAIYNAACVPMALAGWLPPWAAGLGMAASSLVVIANALRLDAPRPALASR
jgi:Cu2+-exporting ATPase